MVLIQLADHRLEQVVTVSARFSLDDGLKDVEQALSLKADLVVRRAEVLSDSRYDHGQVCVDESSQVGNAHDLFKAGLCTGLHLQVVVLEKLTVGIHQLDEAGRGGVPHGASI